MGSFVKRWKILEEWKKVAEKPGRRVIMVTSMI
jgi:hypothetical protein